jgi:1-pyrroline-5-carboxylate dehydrogenase
MPTLTYATIYADGLGDEGKSTRFDATLAALRAGDPVVCGHRIDGEDRDTGLEFTRIDPTTDEQIVAIGRQADQLTVAHAVTSARRALPHWRSTPYQDRVALLQGLSAAVSQREVELAALVSLETGKTRADAFAEVAECAAIVDLFCRQMQESDGYRVPHRPPSTSARADVVLMPYGVFGVIAPFNFPLAIAFSMAIGALITGNTVVFKPSALTPRSGAVFADLLGEINVPPGVFNLVQGGAETGRHLISSEVDGIAFTGSAEVGNAIRAALSSPFVRPVLAEMGGKNPAIITASTHDLGEAATAVARSAFGMSGQKCNACSRAVVHADVYDDFIEALVGTRGRFTVGDPLEPSSFTGPVIQPSSVARFRDAVSTAREAGTVRGGGGTTDSEGNYVDLTIVDRLPAGHPLTREELFLPLLAVTKVDSFDEALAEANAVRYGLSAGIFTEDANERDRFLEEIEAGIVFVNNPGGATTGVWPGSQTMSGWKASGSSGKGGFGPWYLQQFVREQSRTVFSR